MIAGPVWCVLDVCPHTSDISDPDIADTDIAGLGVAEPFAVVAVRVLLFQFLAYPEPLVLPGAPPIYELEVYFVVDKSVINRYVAEQTSGNSVRNGMVSLKADINYFISEMNEIFASLRPMGLHIVILKRKLSVLDVNLFLDNVPAMLALKAFNHWLQKQGPAEYDAAILWTGLNFQELGRAYLGKVCKSSFASGIVFYDMTYQVSIVTAHELGHILGAHHDPALTGFLMAPHIGTLDTKRWQFSLPSKNYFDALFAKPSSSCLRSTTTDRTAPSTGVTVALANPDTICRRAKRNKGSYMCKVNTDDFMKMLIERKDPFFFYSD
ncbi:metalloproteinase [Plakobranchus ocellatus]|uniref:Metalloproteinase n=1 Tax=Plakobranchus ocellatus TaxID=259542 RepID=A0AAV4D7K7_9GAST|nr:metalloproteinase [Plakobranchus ocellatus]